MKRGFYIIPFIVFFIACSEKEDEVVSFDDLKRTESKEDFKTDTTTLKNTGVKLDPNFTLGKGIDTLFGKGEWMLWDTALYVQRFGPKSSLSYRFKNSKDSIQVFQMDFVDSLKTMNAFYNWLDCFGTTCSSIRVGGTFKNKGRSQLILVDNHQILSLEGAQKYDLEKLINALQKDKKKQNWNYVLVLPSRKKAEWLQVKEGGINSLKP